MIKSFWNEEWKEIQFDDTISEKEKYKISNHGRIINCKTDQEFLVKEAYINGYQYLRLKQKSGKQTARYVHKLVAQHFLEQNNGVYVIHLDYNKTYNHVSNLKWATKQEKEKHQFSNPAHKNRPPSQLIRNAKLTYGEVRLIKKKINDPNRKTRLKIIAKRFGISEMQLHRIKTGENWSHVTIEPEP